MAKSVDQIRAQIAKLQEQERAALQKEAAGVIAKIRVAVEHYGITVDQIFGSNGAKKASTKRGSAKKPSGRLALAAPEERASKKVSASKGTKVAAKFKDDAGNSWSGRGSQPRWLRSAIEGGKKLEDFAVA